MGLSQLALSIQGVTMAGQRSKRPLISSSIVTILLLLKVFSPKRTSQVAASAKYHADIGEGESTREKKKYAAKVIFILLTVISGVAGWLLFSAARSGLPT